VDSAASGLKLTTTVTLLEDGTARFEEFSGQAFGQAAGW